MSQSEIPSVVVIVLVIAGRGCSDWHYDTWERLAAMPAAGTDQVLAVIGGFHIVPLLNDEYIRQALTEFRGIDPKYIIAAHCTGERFYDLARSELGERVIHSAVGTRFMFAGG